MVVLIVIISLKTLIFFKKFLFTKSYINHNSFFKYVLNDSFENFLLVIAYAVGVSDIIWQSIWKSWTSANSVPLVPDFDEFFDFMADFFHGDNDIASCCEIFDGTFPFLDDEFLVVEL